MHKAFKYIVVLFLLPVSLKSQEVRVTAKLDTNKIYVGDQIWYTITVNQPDSLILAIPAFKDTIISKIDIVSGPETDTSTLNPGIIKIRNRYLITSFDSGYYNIPPVFAEASDKQGLRRFYSGYNQLEVMRVRIAPADTTQKIYDIIKPYNAPLTAGEILPWLLLALVVVLAVFILVRLIRRIKKKEKHFVIPERIEPAHIIAFRDLEKLKAEELWQKGEYKIYCTRLTEILRVYLENRYGVNSLEMTTSETLNALLKTGFRKGGSFDLLKSVLTLSDMVKFAKYVPATGENETLFNGAWEFVLQTKMQEEVTADNTSEGKEVKE